MSWIDWYNALDSNEHSDPWFVLKAILRYLDSEQIPPPDYTKEDS